VGGAEDIHASLAYDALLADGEGGDRSS
jgi:hypothetical protein